MHIQVNPEVLSRAIRACAIASYNPPKSARADDRPALRGVLLQALRGGELDVVGTDGRWLARWRMPARMLNDARPSGCVIEPASVKPLCAWLDTHSDDELVRIDVELPAAEARSERGGTFEFATRDAGQYPRYEQVIPEYEHDMGAPVVGFDGALLSAVAEAFRIASGAKRGRAVPLTFELGREDYDPAIVTSSSTPDMIATVMPLRRPAVGQYSLKTERA
jgi:DNA polymerase III sliding clamp (beta) subunit (PCNA family)